MGDTLADLFREAGLSPAWRNTSEANSPPRRPMPRQMRTRAPTYADVQRDLPRGEAYAPPTNQIAGAGQQALEMTGLPSVRRSARAFTNGDPRTGAEEGALGLLGVAGVAGLVPRGRAPVRPMAAAEAPVIAPRPEPRLPGRASDGSVLPVRPREPFRNSLRGGSEDLAGAARPANDIGAMRRLAPMPNQPPAQYGTTVDLGGDRVSVARVAAGQINAAERSAPYWVDEVRKASADGIRNRLEGIGSRIKRVHSQEGAVAVARALAREYPQLGRRPADFASVNDSAYAEDFIDQIGRALLPARNVDGFLQARGLDPRSFGRAEIKTLQTQLDRGEAAADRWLAYRQSWNDPPDTSKSSRRPKPPSGGFLLPRRP